MALYYPKTDYPKKIFGEHSLSVFGESAKNGEFRPERGKQDNGFLPKSPLGVGGAGTGTNTKTEYIYKKQGS